jgi:uncharacterized protein (DUF952 family)
MILIEGNFSILGSSPDGDSIRFIPNNPELWQKLEQPVHTNQVGGIQLRLDAIDSLETHFQAPHSRHVYHQPLKYGELAAARLLEMLGFGTIQRDGSGRVMAANPAIAPGYILASVADQYGRALALGFAGRSGKADGHKVVTNLAWLQQSVNYQLLREGMVYPIFYRNQSVRVRQILTEAVVAARVTQAGLWADDRTTGGFEIVGIETLTQDVVIFPKLFRRLMGYFAQQGDVDLVGLGDYLTVNSDRLYLASDEHMLTLYQLLKIDGQTVQLLHPLEDLLFMEK